MSNSSSSSLSGLSTFGLVLGASGALLSSIGAYYGVQSQQYALRSRALDLELEGSLSDLNARAAEREAADVLKAGRDEKGRVTLQYGQAKAAGEVRTAAAGLQGGVGSAAEVQASIELAKQIDAGTIEQNALRAAQAARTRAVDLRNRALLARTGAANARRLAGSLSPGLAALTSTIGGAGQVAQSYLAQQSFGGY